MGIEHDSRIRHRHRGKLVEQTAGAQGPFATKRMSHDADSVGIYVWPIGENVIRIGRGVTEHRKRLDFGLIDVRVI
jgi:hypothetical protein